MAVAIGEDGSVVLAGKTSGHWAGEADGMTFDFAAVKLDADGREMWRWQVCAWHERERERRERDVLD